MDIDETEEEGTITMATTEERTPLIAKERQEKLRCMSGSTTNDLGVCLKVPRSILIGRDQERIS